MSRPSTGTPEPIESIAARMGAYDWPHLLDHLNRQGYAVLPRLLAAAECNTLAALYSVASSTNITIPSVDEAPPAPGAGDLRHHASPLATRPVDAEAAPAPGAHPSDLARSQTTATGVQLSPFRSRVIMARHGFGRGEYQYFRYPLPPLIQQLRTTVYPRLTPLANAWSQALGLDRLYPAHHDDYLHQCHAAGQTQPTPLLLQYQSGDYNCLHQDLYGAEVFPLQLAILLSSPGEDFTGGEFVMTEQRPRMQSRPMVVPLRQGDGVLFAVQHRPAQGSRGVYRVNLRHGVSEVHSGRRHTVGIIFHDAS